MRAVGGLIYNSKGCYHKAVELELSCLRVLLNCSREADTGGLRSQRRPALWNLAMVTFFFVAAWGHSVRYLLERECEKKNDGKLRLFEFDTGNDHDRVGPRGTQRLTQRLSLLCGHGG